MTKLKTIWLDVFYQIRLAIAEKLINITLSIIPNGPEGIQFAFLMIQYSSFARKELEREEQIR